MEIFLNVILPVLMVTFVGYVFQRIKKIDVRILSSVVINILTASLVFRTFYTMKLDSQYFSVIIISLAIFAVLVVITGLFARLMKYEPSETNSLLMAVGFMNSGNYGAPITLLAYGQLAFDYAISIMVLHTMMINTFGVYFAVRGKGNKLEALLTIFKLPLLYAAIIAIFMQLLKLNVPANLYLMIDTFADAAIPMVMLIFGMQLAEINLKDLKWSLISFGTVARLLISPLIAYVVLLFFTLEPLVEKVLILLAAMPATTLAVIYAIEYDTAPDVVSSITFITSMVSIATITILLYIL